MRRVSSLSGRLLRPVLTILTVVLLVLGVFSALKSHNEIQELADGRLAESARTLQVLISHSDRHALLQDGGSPIIVPSSELAAMRTYQAEVGFQVFDEAGHVLLSTQNLTTLPPIQSEKSGYQDVQSGRHRWRLFSQWDPADRVIIRTAERNDSRRDISRALWIEHGAPLLVVLPLLAVLMYWAIQRGLSPLRELAQLLAQRAPGSREPVVIEQPPAELVPVIAALNTQLHALEDALEREQRFSADVAHELRTPISSAMVNLDNAQATLNSGDARAAMDGARDSLQHLARKMEQLLALARIESSNGNLQQLDLVRLTGDLIDELAPLIAHSQIEMSVEFAQPQIWIQGHEAALAAMLRNLIENALRHVPSGGQVHITIAEHEHSVAVNVIDDGEGIPAERRAAVFARFHREQGSRGEGYGLGLSIVQRAAALHHAEVELLDSPFGKGLRVRIIMPKPQKA